MYMYMYGDYEGRMEGYDPLMWSFQLAAGHKHLWIVNQEDRNLYYKVFNL